jgi:predicted esterase
MASSIRTHRRETVRTGRYATIGAQHSDARRLWFALHGYGQLAERFLRPFAAVTPADTCIVAPEGLNRFYRDAPTGDGSHLAKVGATWMTREAREDDIADTLRWLATVYEDVAASGVASGRIEAIGVLGFSQGVATATRWIATGRVRVNAFVVWAGALAVDADQARLRERLREVEVTFVSGDADPFVGEEARHAAMTTLRSLQPSARAIAFAGAHALDAPTLAPILTALAPRG